MLKKCLHYDLKHIMTYWSIGAVTLLVLSIFAGLAERSDYIHASEVDRFNWEPLVMVLFYFMFVAFILLSAILVFMRFYNHFFSDEGYLTFTLPVKRRVLYTSKVLNGVIWVVLTVGVCLLAFLIKNSFTASLKVPQAPPVEVEPIFSAFWNVAISIELIILSIIYCFAFIIGLYFIITLGATIAKKNRVITTIGIGYGISIGFSILSYLAILIFSVYALSTIELFPDGPSNPGLFLFMLLGLAGSVMLTSTIGIAYLNLRLLERKLNLA